MLGSSRISTSSKLSCMLSLPASMKRIRLRTAEKKWRHHFSHYKPMGIFSDFQGQLTPQWVVQSSRNSNLSELSCMSSLPANMKRIRSRTVEKKWRHHFSHYKPMGIFSDIQGQLTPQPVFRGGRNSNSFELSCMLSLPASMKRIG